MAAYSGDTVRITFLIAGTPYKSNFYERREDSRAISSEALSIESMNGIYFLEIGGAFYIGKDAKIENKSRIKNHLALLKEGSHYNTKLQLAYDHVKEIDYGVLLTCECTLEGLIELEIKYIKLYDSYNYGYNLTTGGYGLPGYKFSAKQLAVKSERVIGDRNPMSKLSRDDFHEVVSMLIKGSTNVDIAKKFGLHDRYVSLIRHKRRFVEWWKDYPDYLPINSEGNINARGKVSREVFKEIVYMLRDGKTNAEIERKYGLSAGTGSRIRNKKLYKQWWIRLEEEERSTTRA
ncbi:nuclease [Alkalihalobacillus sp. LMS6]|uniref:nuclease n=1 Tax=Alkalihalobacillus sp. LMS6 TaxID=2924034 RepID=UPI0020D0FA75|nr:nuclease [Alkalihalobacillus sp. LMS6]UTR05180.1 nuclease [Alkalihalobacillus sp. LMS6]